MLTLCFSTLRLVVQQDTREGTQEYQHTENIKKLCYNTDYSYVKQHMVGN